MVDNRSAGVLGIGGGINFKSGDISGTAAKTSDDRASQGTEYFLQDANEEQLQQNDGFVDRSMQLRASLNSLALLNVVSVLRNKKKSILFEEKKSKPSPKVKRVEKISHFEEDNNNKNK